MSVYVWGLVGILVFYIVMLGVGFWAGTKQKNQSEEEVMLAGRSIGTVVGVLTLIGMWQHFSYFSSTIISPPFVVVVFTTEFFLFFAVVTSYQIRDILTKKCHLQASVQ